MWSKFSNALKTRPDNDQSQQSAIPTSSNLRVQNSSLPDPSPNHTEFPIPQPSPPSSPSKNGRLGLFKRGTKHSKPDTPEGITPLKLPLHLPKKVKSSLHLNTSDLPRSSTDSNMLSPDTALPPLTPLLENSRSTGSVRSILRDRKTPATGQSVRFFSRDAYKVITPDPSVTTNSEPSDPPLLQRLQQVDTDAEDTRYHSAFASPGAIPIPRSKTPQLDIVSASAPTMESPLALPMTLQSSSSASLLVTIPPPNLSNLFDVSQEYEIKAIPMSEEGRLRDDAFEVTDFDETVEGESQPPDTARTTEPLGTPSPPASNMNTNTIRGPSLSLETKSLGRRAGEVIAQSFSTKALPTRSSSSLGLYKMFGNGPTEDQLPSSIPSSSSSSSNQSSSSSNIRNRALSDTVFHRPTFSQESIPKIPEQDIHDTSASSIVLYGNGNLEPPDPFRANATTYYTPETRISNSPPRSHHTKSDSNATSSGYSFSTPSLSSRASEDAVMELRTQLALQQELSHQYEIDLNARDSLVENLTARLDASEKEDVKRRSVMKSWKKKVVELERAYRSLEEEVEKSRMESFERSIMDEASGEALRMLHRQIEKLEREKGEIEKREEGFLGERTRLNAVIMEKEELIEAMRRAESGNTNANVNFSGSEDAEKLRSLLENAEQKIADMLIKLDSCNADLETVWNEKGVLESDIADFKEKYGNSLKEIEVMKRELEAQWRNTEAASEKMKAFESERAEWRRDLESWETKATEMELEWTDMENKRAEMEAELGEVWEARRELESHRDELINDLKMEQDLIAQLRIDLEQKTNQLSVLREENKFNCDNASRMEAAVRTRDGELSEYSEKMLEQRQQIEELESELSLYKKDQDRVIEEQRRNVKEALRREADSKTHLEAVVKEKAELEVLAKNLKDHEENLSAENEKLRRKVHDLVQADADKDIKISNYKKIHEKDEEDKNQLNIALDSKQQELELLKRRLGVRGTAGATPAPPTRTTTTNRRESFATPVPLRPGSALSDIGFGKDVGVTPTAATIPALGKSSRMNTVLSSSTNGTASQPPPSAMKGRFVDGSMGPPVSTSVAARPRSSLSGTSSMSSSVTTPATARRMSTTATVLSRSTTASARPSIGTPSTLKAHRQASSVSLRSETSSVQDEKENIPAKSASANAVKASRRVSLKPTPVPTSSCS